MGKYDSSRTRVVPVFDALMDRDPTGSTWLLPLLKLGSRAAGRLDDVTQATLRPNHPRWWGKHERRLIPPVSLLRWLIANASAPTADALWGSGNTRTRRQRLVARHSETIDEALRLLEAPLPSRGWYVLEGRSQPDVFLETDAMVVVIEGKRTERKATTVTTWMRTRNQMLRHMDAAWEISDGRRVLGLMIVEGQGGAPATAPNEHWLTQAQGCSSPETLAASLPHRESEVRDRIAHGFLGVATWQGVCAALQLAWPPFADGD